ncbi:MAG TPA: hypothetical protein VME70_12595 [Mycobacteriales bacterium]|nr:hypothetical protein [Mycobacteriales bacterium]
MGAEAAPRGYLRGGTGLAVDGRTVGLVTVWVVVVSLAALAGALFVGAVGAERRDAELRAHGTPVRVTVTSCYGRASGTGITVDGYVCRVAFAFDGVRRTTVLGGSTVLREPGRVLTAVVDPYSPTTVRTPGSLTAGSHWLPFAAPAALAAVALVVGVVFGGLRRRPSPDAKRPGPHRTGPLRCGAIDQIGCG